MRIDKSPAIVAGTLFVTQFAPIVCRSRLMEVLELRPDELAAPASGFSGCLGIHSLANILHEAILARRVSEGVLTNSLAHAF